MQKEEGGKVAVRCIFLTIARLTGNCCLFTRARGQRRNTPYTYIVTSGGSRLQKPLHKFLSQGLGQKKAGH